MSGLAFAVLLLVIHGGDAESCDEVFTKSSKLSKAFFFKKLNR